MNMRVISGGGFVCVLGPQKIHAYSRLPTSLTTLWMISEPVPRMPDRYLSIIMSQSRFPQIPLFIPNFSMEQTKMIVRLFVILIWMLILIVMPPI